jgi:hypothetical protein
MALVGKSCLQCNLGDRQPCFFAVDPGTSVWATGIDGSNPGYLVLGSYGSLRLWDANNNIWSRTASDVIPAPTAGYNFCVKEGGTCNFTGAGRVLMERRDKQRTPGMTSPTALHAPLLRSGEMILIRA